MRSMSVDDASWQPSHAIINCEFEAQSLIHLAPQLLLSAMVVHLILCAMCYVSVLCFSVLFLPPAFKD